jgi:hypothetical protein
VHSRRSAKKCEYGAGRVKSLWELRDASASAIDAYGPCILFKYQLSKTKVDEQCDTAIACSDRADVPARSAALRRLLPSRYLPATPSANRERQRADARCRRRSHRLRIFRQRSAPLFLGRPSSQPVLFRDHQVIVQSHSRVSEEGTWHRLRWFAINGREQFHVEAWNTEDRDRTASSLARNVCPKYNPKLTRRSASARPEK